ncbi:MAG: endonuclease/exonuclease/phosphatase family protein [Thermoleophilia bacterium]|nr:endonuclease/exonuclease/phosphatase family protein [Thermoleophilia bacterium]
MIDKENNSIRIMVFNIHRWTGQDQRLDVARLASVIHESGADVVGLNEVLHPVSGGGRIREPLADLADRLDMDFHFGPSGWLDFGPGWHGPVGNALLSRERLTNVSNTLLPRLPGTKQRSLLGASLDSGPAAGLYAFVTHLDHAFEGTRITQIRGALSCITHDGPHFICGDFNSPGFHGIRTRRLSFPVLRWMHRAGYEDAFRATGQGSGRTYPSGRPIFRVDFIFFPTEWVTGLSSAMVVDTTAARWASDHRPLTADWSRPRTGPGTVNDGF